MLKWFVGMFIIVPIFTGILLGCFFVAAGVVGFIGYYDHGIPMFPKGLGLLEWLDNQDGIVQIIILAPVFVATVCLALFFLVVICSGVNYATGGLAKKIFDYFIP